MPTWQRGDKTGPFSCATLALPCLRLCDLESATLTQHGPLPALFALLGHPSPVSLVFFLFINRLCFLEPFLVHGEIGQKAQSSPPPSPPQHAVSPTVRPHPTASRRASVGRSPPWSAGPTGAASRWCASCAPRRPLCGALCRSPPSPLSHLPLFTPPHLAFLSTPLPICKGRLPDQPSCPGRGPRHQAWGPVRAAALLE